MVMLINRNDLSNSVRVRCASLYGYLPLFNYLIENNQSFEIFVLSSIKLVYGDTKRKLTVREVNGKQTLLNFTFVTVVREENDSAMEEITEVARWLAMLNTAMRSSGSSVDPKWIPWLFLRKNLSDLYLVDLRRVATYMRTLKPTFVHDIFQRERFRLAYQWELSYYLDREAVASVTGAYFANSKLASYFDLEPLSENEILVRDHNVATLLPRSRDNQIYNYYERGILVYGLLRLGGMPAKAILQQFVNSVFLVPQTTVCNNVYVIENTAVPIISYRPVLAIFNYYLDSYTIKQHDYSTTETIYFLNGIHNYIKKYGVDYFLPKNENKSLDDAQFLSFAATHQPWFFCSLTPVMQKMWCIALLALFQKFKMTEEWINLMKSHYSEFAQLNFDSYFLMFLSTGSNDFFANLIIFDNIHKNFEGYFPQSNIEPLKRQRFALQFMEVICVCVTRYAYQAQAMRKFYLPDPNWCAVSIGWFQNNSAFAKASLTNFSLVQYHTLGSVNLLEDIFRSRVRYYFGPLVINSRNVGEISPALNFDAIYNREFVLNDLFGDSAFFSIENKQSLEFLFLNSYSIFEMVEQFLKVFSYQHVYLSACFSQYFRMMYNWFGTINFCYGNTTIEAYNKTYFEWYNDQYINELSKNPCYEHLNVDFVGQNIALLSYPQVKLPDFIGKFNYRFANALAELASECFPIGGAPLLISFQLSGEPIVLPIGNEFYASIKTKEWAKKGPEPLLFTDQISAAMEEFYLEAPNHLSYQQTLTSNDGLLERNPTLVLRTHGVFWYLLNQLEFLEWTVKRDMQEFGRIKPENEPRTCDWILRRFQEVLLSQIEFDVAGQFRLRLRQPLSSLIPPYCGLLVLSNLPINGAPSLLTSFGTDPEPLAVLVVVMERLITNFGADADFAVAVADQFLKFQRENPVSVDSKVLLEKDPVLNAFALLAFNFECAPMGFPLTLEEIGYMDLNHPHRQSLFFDHLFSVNDQGKIVPRDGKIYPYNLMSRIEGHTKENLLVPYVAAVKADLDHFVIFLRHVGNLFYGPDFVDRCHSTAGKKLVLAP